MAPTVSVNLCCYNSEKYLRETLQSIINQTYTDWELIIINDGSSDSTESIIHEYIKQGYPIIYHYQENKGLGYSRNEALKRSQGEFIAFIDHDDIWMPEKLGKQISLFNKNPNLGIVFCDVLYFNKNGIQRQAYRHNKPPVGMIFSSLLNKYFIVLSSVLISRDALFSLTDWFDERFDMIEEMDLFLRISHSYEAEYADETLAMWRMHKSNLSFSKPELVPKELEIMLGKFSVQIANFETEFSNEIISLQSRIAKMYAISDMRKGDKVNARAHLKPFLSTNFIIKIYYLFTYLPYSTFRFVRKHYTGIAPPS